MTSAKPGIAEGGAAAHQRLRRAARAGIRGCLGSATVAAWATVSETSESAKASVTGSSATEDPWFLLLQSGLIPPTGGDRQAGVLGVARVALRSFAEGEGRASRVAHQAL